MTAPAGREQLLERLADSAPYFDFFQLVRMVLRGAGRLDHRRRAPGQQPVRFRANASFQFKASDVQSITLPKTPDQPATIAVNFLGIASPGVVGSLPNWYAQDALAEATDRDDPNPAMAEFFAMFDDRLIHLYFRAWLRNNVPIQYELQKDGVIARVLQSAIGFGSPAIAALLPLDPRALVHHAAMLARRPTTAAGLAQSLSTWFGVAFEVEPFAELVTELESEQRLRLGDHAMRLGETTVVGDSVRTRQGKFRLRAGPLSWADFVGFLPGSDGVPDGDKLAELISWVRQSTGGEFDYDLQLELREDAVPVLEFRADDPARARLGLSMWLGARLQGGTATDTVVQVSDLESSRNQARRKAAAGSRS